MTSHTGDFLRRPVNRCFFLKLFDGYVESAANRLGLEVKGWWSQLQLGTQCADQGCEQSCGFVLSGVDPLDSRLDAVNLYSDKEIVSTDSL